MDITPVIAAIQQHADWVVFVSVLTQQLGLPIPAIPTLLVAGSLAASSGQAGGMLVAAVLASVIADGLWYLTGRAFGYRVLSGLCRLSINPGSCVSETESRFVRWGVWSLIIAKFIPGFSTVAPPIAGSLRMRPSSFIVAAALGAALWAGAAIFVGWWWRTQVSVAIDAMSNHGTGVITALVLALSAWLIWKLWQKYRFQQLRAIPFISSPELAAALASNTPPLLLDLRGPAMIAQTGVVPGGTLASLSDLPESVRDWAKDDAIVTLCACPQDAIAVEAVHALHALGYTSVRPLTGGYESWIRQLAQQGRRSPQSSCSPAS